MISKLAKLAASCALMAVFGAHASIVSIGNLSRDTNTNLIVDSLNGREWLSWSETAGKTYAQVVAGTALGGAFEGFSIAHNIDAQLFVNAAISPNLCTATNDASCATSALLNAIVPLVGANYIVGFESLAFFLSDNAVGQQIGVLDVFASNIYKVNEYVSSSSADSIAVGNNWGWLLYRGESTTTVPEPGTLALVGLALAGAVASRRKRA